MEIVIKDAIASIKTFAKKEIHVPFCDLVPDYKLRTGGTFFRPEYTIVPLAAISRINGQYEGQATEQIDKTYVEDGKLYLMPHCCIHTMDGKSRNKFFNTAEELDQFVNRIGIEMDGIVIE